MFPVILTVMLDASGVRTVDERELTNISKSLGVSYVHVRPRSRFVSTPRLPSNRVATVRAFHQLNRQQIGLPRFEFRFHLQFRVRFLKKFPFLRFLTVLNNPKFCYALCICMPKQVGMIEQNDHHIFLEFGLSHTSHSKILDCLELLRTKEIENFYKSYT